MVYVAEKHRKQLGYFREANNELANDSALQMITLTIVMQYPGGSWDSKMGSHSLCKMLVSVTRVVKAAGNRLSDLSEVRYNCDRD